MPPPGWLRRARRRLAARLLVAATLVLVMAGFGPAMSTWGTERPAAVDPCSPASGVTCVFDIPFVARGTSVLTLDAYYPTNEVDRASVVIVHGGEWFRGDSRVYEPEALYFAQNGFAVFSVNYTLAQPGRPSWPAAFADVEVATAWVMTNAEAYHGDGHRVGLLGGSAGGQLAALVDTAGPEDGVAPLATVVWSGPLDLVNTYDKGNKMARNDVLEYLGCTPAECRSTYAAASPVDHVTSGDGSMLFFHSENERLPIGGAFEMNRALAAAGVSHRLVVLKHSMEHARSYECALAKVEGQTLSVLDDSMRYLGTHLGQPTTPTGTYCR